MALVMKPKVTAASRVMFPRSLPRRYSASETGVEPATSPIPVRRSFSRAPFTR